MQTIFISSIHSWLRKKIRYHEYRNRQRNRINHEKYTKNNQILLYFVLCEQNNMKDCNRKFYWCTKNVYNSIDCGDYAIFILGIQSRWCFHSNIFKYVNCECQLLAYVRINRIGINNAGILVLPFKITHNLMILKRQ